jgi:hypothetical protein
MYGKLQGVGAKRHGITVTLQDIIREVHDR